MISRHSNRPVTLFLSFEFNWHKHLISLLFWTVVLFLRMASYKQLQIISMMCLLEQSYSLDFDSAVKNGRFQEITKDSSFEMNPSSNPSISMYYDINEKSTRDINLNHLRFHDQTNWYRKRYKEKVFCSWQMNNWL